MPSPTLPAVRTFATAPATRCVRLMTASLPQRLAAVGLMLTLSACSSFQMPSWHMPQMHLPFTHPKQPDLTPSHASAENMVRLDAAMRSGCDQVDNIERPDNANPRDQAPQRWIARTCTGDISYDVVTQPGPNGPVVKVTPVPGPMNRPMNPNFHPAMPEDAK